MKQSRIGYAPEYSGKILYESETKPYIERVGITVEFGQLLRWLPVSV